jgi:hypothetical protein
MMPARSWAGRRFSARNMGTAAASMSKITEAEIEAAARSLAMTVVSGSRETNPDAPRPGDGKPRWMNWKWVALEALEAAERVRRQGTQGEG